MALPDRQVVKMIIEKQEIVPITHKEIALTKGVVAIVDNDDYNELVKHKWYAQLMGGCLYAARSTRVGNKKPIITMARQIMDCPKGLQVDHKNHNTLDNRKCNLRNCTSQQNTYNRRSSKSGTSKYKGVSWHKAAKKWYAAIIIDGQQISLGYFSKETEAAEAYDKKAGILQKEFAWLNKDHFKW